MDATWRSPILVVHNTHLDVGGYRNAQALLWSNKERVLIIDKNYSVLRYNPLKELTQ